MRGLRSDASPGRRSDVPESPRVGPTSGGVQATIRLAEPMLFLQAQAGDTDRRGPASTAMLRGSLHLHVAKSAKIKTVTLKFRGRATTQWPEGIPPRKVDLEETQNIMSHTWPFFNAQFPNAEHGTNADRFDPADSDTPIRDSRRRSLQPDAPNVSSKGYRTFHPGDYYYNFELPLDSRLPETIDVDLGSVRYELETIVERAGAFKTNLINQQEVRLVRVPAEGSLEQVEPIAISRTWEDQLHYEIVISGKSFPLGSQVPIAFKLTPLAKVHCHRIKIMMTQNIEYFCSNKRIHRKEPIDKVLLVDKRADAVLDTSFPGSSMRITAGGGVPYDSRATAASGVEVPTMDPGNLLGDLHGESNIGPTEMEFSVQLPGCESVYKPGVKRLHFDTTYQNIQVHHWIKIILRLSKPDPVDPRKRRHFEISIDSPFHLLSCRATQANTSLPAYSVPNATGQTALYECGCPNAPRRSPLDGYTFDEPQPQPEPARPPTAHIYNEPRPIHMLRAPSFNPPAFEAEEPPPPLVTPPPQYDDIASPTSGLADYFARLSDAYDTGDETGSGRVEVPLTPGARANRSMDLGRRWVPL